MRRIVMGTVGTAVLGSVIAFGGASAQALPMPGVGGTPSYSVVDKTTTYNYTDYSQEIARCTAKNTTQTCSIGKGKSSSRTVETDFGASYDAITASLHISDERTVEVTVNCSATIKKGQTYVAWAQGTRYRYHVKSVLNYYGGSRTSISSEWKYAFSPGATKITCGLA